MTSTDICHSLNDHLQRAMLEMQPDPEWVGYLPHGGHFVGRQRHEPVIRIMSDSDNQGEGNENKSVVVE